MAFGKSGASRLVLHDGSVFSGKSFGAPVSAAGEVVFNTGMVGYPESMTDPSYCGQILVLTYPLIGNYGVPRKQDGLLDYLESSRIQIKGLIVSDPSSNYSHWNADTSLSDWMADENVPGLFDIDTRSLTKKLRQEGTTLGKMIYGKKDVLFYDPNQEILQDKVSIRSPVTYGKGKTHIIAVDCGMKNNILRSFLARKVKVTRVPYDYDFSKMHHDGLFLSNGPGDPKKVQATIENIRTAYDAEKPIFGICMGNQLMALAAGGDTYKLKFGHRSQNQPCVESTTKRCYITSQNHGFAVDEKKLPSGWESWFRNANDGTNEGIRHKAKPFMSVQFHPEHMPGPVDTSFLFDMFLDTVKNG